jgi:hypothetical protein
MAGGIDWFRWHHGSVTDPKFQLVARKSKQALASVIAVWAFVLEQASASAERGTFGSIDGEAIDCLLGLEDGATNAILAAMGERGLVEDGFVSAWEKRQPKRERTDNTSTERSRAYRAKQHQAAQNSDEQRHATPELSDATQCNSTQHQKKPREEESREEDKEANASVGGADRLPRCDTQSVVDLYHDTLPELPRVRLMTDGRRKAISAFWRFVLTSKKSDGSPRATNADEAMDWISGYFTRARDNDFLMGRGHKAPGHEGWQCDFDFLLSEKGKKHVLEKTQVHA